MAREKACNAAVTRGRLARARAFLEAADLVADVNEGDDSTQGELAAALVTLWVHAGIAAADVICCVRLGRHHSGEDHQAAVKLLRAADKGQETALDRLLAMKTPAGYGHRLISADNRLRARRAAERSSGVRRKSGRQASVSLLAADMGLLRHLGGTPLGPSITRTAGLTGG